MGELNMNMDLRALFTFPFPLSKSGFTRVVFQTGGI